MNSDFDSLRREATKLERHLEERVARYQQVRYERGNDGMSRRNGT